jgi:hypothetical protein
MGTVKVSLNYTHKVFSSQVNSSSNTNFPWLSPTENSSRNCSHNSVTQSLSLSLLVPIHSPHVIPPLQFLSASLGILLTYIAKGPTLTNSKHISRDPTHCCCVASPHMRIWRKRRKHMSRDGHLLLMCAWHMENSLFCCCGHVFCLQELLPGNALIKYATVYLTIRKSDVFEVSIMFYKFLEIISTSLVVLRWHLVTLYPFHGPVWQQPWPEGIRCHHVVLQSCAWRNITALETLYSSEDNQLHF